MYLQTVFVMISLKLHYVAKITALAKCCFIKELLKNLIQQVTRLQQKVCKKYDYNFVDNERVSKRDLWSDGVNLPELGKMKTEKNLIRSFDRFLGGYKQYESIGKEKDFAYSENNCN